MHALLFYDVRLLFLVCCVRQKHRLIKVSSSVSCECVKVNFFCFFKWRCVKSMLSPLSMKSYGGSCILEGKEIGLHCGNVPVVNNANRFLFQKAKYA